MKDLKDLTLQEYEGLKKTGFLWEFYPEATGGANEDLEAVCVKYTDDYIQIPPQGSESHYTSSILRLKKYFFYDIRDEEAEYDW